MKFYYVEDTMFLDNAISKEIFARFRRLIENNETHTIMISTTLKKTKCMTSFIQSLEGTASVITSPAHMTLNGLHGNLKSTSLELGYFPLMKPYSGSCVEYDVDKKSCQRIYLEMFLNSEVADFDSIVEEFEQILSEKINTIKKKKTSIH